MTSIRTVAIACTIAAAAMLPVTAYGQSGLPNQDTYFTFSQAVELPGGTLPAGTYLFQLADSPSNRHVVRIMSQDRRTLHRTLLAIPNYTLEKPSDEPQVRFMEGPETGPQAVKVWFYPGRSVGHEFIYPRSQATRLAARTGESVLTTKTDSAVVDTVADTDMTRVDRNGSDAAVAAENNQASAQPAPTSAETERTPASTAQAQPTRTEPTAPPASTPERTTERAEPVRTDRTDLPSTAGFLPLLALIGLGSLAASRFMRSRRVRS
jgi:hypothetical protein